MRGLASLQSVGQASRLDSQAGVDAAALRRNFFWKAHIYSYGLSTAWMRPIYIWKVNLLSLKSAGLSVLTTSTQYLKATPRLVFGQITGCCCLIELTSKTNHHNVCKEDALVHRAAIHEEGERHPTVFSLADLLYAEGNQKQKRNKWKDYREHREYFCLNTPWSKLQKISK